MWKLTLPQLGYYLEQANEHIQFTIKVSTMSLGSLGMFGGGAAPEEQGEVVKEDGTYIDGYKVADEEDMDFLAKIM